MRFASGLGNYPGPQLPGRRMTDVLRVAAGQFGHPVILFILKKACDLLFHNQ